MSIDPRGPTPSINVNLEQCRCGGCQVVHATTYVRSTIHLDTCPGAPVVLPCPLPPTVAFTVRVGECVATCRTRFPCVEPRAHSSYCPTHFVCVVCSISGETWAESEVAGGYTGTPSGSLAALERELSACRERWALVKAIVLNLTAGPGAIRHELRPLIEQRDAVYAAIAKIATAEKLIPQGFMDIDRVYTNHGRRPFRGVAAAELAAYVRHLTTQVGTLP